MVNKYVYKDEDITLDVIMKIESIIRIISEREHRSFDDCYADFATSNTYQALQNTETLMWAESTEFIVDEYYRESFNKKED